MDRGPLPNVVTFGQFMLISGSGCKHHSDLITDTTLQIMGTVKRWEIIHDGDGLKLNGERTLTLLHDL